MSASQVSMSFDRTDRIVHTLAHCEQRVAVNVAGVEFRDLIGRCLQRRLAGPRQCGKTTLARRPPGAPRGCRGSKKPSAQAARKAQTKKTSDGALRLQLSNPAQ